MGRKMTIQKRHSFRNKAQDKNRTKRNIWLAGSGILLVLAVVGIWVKYYMPSSERMDLNVYYAQGRSSSDAPALILNDTVQEENALGAENTLYVPVDWINEELDTRFYADTNQMILTDDTHIWLYYPWDTQYLENGESKEDNEIKVVSENNILYVKAEWASQEIGMHCSLLENPKRVWFWTDRDYALLKSNTQLRNAANVKSPILEDLYAGDKVFICEQKEKWTKVQSMSGLVGYVRTKALGDITLVDTQSDAVADSTQESLSRGGVSNTESGRASTATEDSICMIWHQTIGTDGLDGLKNYIESDSLRAVNVISPSWFTFSNNEGDMEYRGNSEYVQLAHENGIRVWAMLDNLNIPVDTLAILSQTDVRFQIEDTLVETALEAEIDGINVDLEALTHDMAIHFIQFLRELAVKCHANGITLSVDNPVPQGWNSYYNLTDQSEVADYIILMSYDEHWAGGEAGSTSSYAFTKDGIEMALQEVPKEKLINGIPLYTRVWNMENQESYAIGMNELDQLFASASDLRIESAWQEDIRQVYVQFSKDGVQYEVWVEDTSSLQWRLDLIDEYDLAGVSAWKLGFETTLVWDMLNVWQQGDFVLNE